MMGKAIYFISSPVISMWCNSFTCLFNAQKDKLTNIGSFFISIQDVLSIWREKLGVKEGVA